MHLEPVARLLRVSNILTPVADVVTGGLMLLWIERATLDLGSWLACGVASVAVYCAGMVFNDVFDRVEDRELRPSRPIPSGEVSVRRASLIGIGLVLLSVIAATLAGLASLVVLAMILVLAWTYDVGPSWLGGLRILLVPACRTLDVVLGATAADIELPFPSAALWTYAAGYGGYILMASSYGRMEDRPVRRGRLPWLALGTLVLLALPLVMGLWAASSRGAFHWLIPAALWGWLASHTLPGVLAAWRTARPEMMGRTVGLLLRGVLLFHGVLVVAIAPTFSWQVGLAFAFIGADQLTRLIARRIPPT